MITTVITAAAKRRSVPVTPANLTGRIMALAPVGYWPLTGDTLDASGNARHGTLTGTEGVDYTWRDDLRLSTGAAEVTIPASSSFIPTSAGFTVFVVAEPTTHAGYIAANDGSVSRNWHVRFPDATRGSAGWRSSAGAWQQNYWPADPPLVRQAIVTVIRPGLTTTPEIYWSGGNPLRGLADRGDGTARATTLPIKIGTGMQGRVAHVAVFDKALTPVEAQGLVDQAITDGLVTGLGTQPLQPPLPAPTPAGGPPVLHDHVVWLPSHGGGWTGTPDLRDLGGGQFYALYRTAGRHSAIRGTVEHGVLIGARSTDWGATWTPELVSDSPEQYDDRDPALTWIPSLNTWVMTYMQWFGPETTPTTGCRVMYRTNPSPTLDPGQWSAPGRILPPGDPWLEQMLACTGPLLIATDGSLICPAYSRASLESTKWSTMLLRSTGGMAGPWNVLYTAPGEADGRSYDEPYPRRLRDGSYLMFSRYDSNNIGRYTSPDGLTWTGPTLNKTLSTGRPTWIELESGTILMGYRTPGGEENRVAFSRDKGLTWSDSTLVPPVAGRLGTYFAFQEVAPNVVAAVYSTEDSLMDGFVHFRYITDGAPQ